MEVPKFGEKRLGWTCLGSASLESSERGRDHLVSPDDHLSSRGGCREAPAPLTLRKHSGNGGLGKRKRKSPRARRTNSVGGTEPPASTHHRQPPLPRPLLAESCRYPAWSMDGCSEEDERLSAVLHTCSWSASPPLVETRKSEGRGQPDSGVSGALFGGPAPRAG